MSLPPVTPVRIHSLGTTGRPPEDWVATEEPMEIRVNGEAIVTLMRTPGHDAELAAGFLVAEGVLTDRREILDIAPCILPNEERPGNILNVFLAPQIRVDLADLRRHVVASSACGVCSKTSIASVRRQFPAVRSRLRIPAEVLYALPGRLLSAQRTFARTGGLHACGWFDSGGNLLVVREDVGRHNALDKLIGHRFLEGIDADADGILLVSGRVAFEIVQKALAARFPIIAAISAPTSLAVEFAEDNGQTLVGFLREQRMNVYTHPERIGA